MSKLSKVEVKKSPSVLKVKDMKYMMRNMKKVAEYKRFIKERDRSEPSEHDGDIERSFDSFGHRVKDYGAPKDFVAHKSNEKYYVNKKEYMKLPEHSPVQMALMPPEYLSAETKA